MIWGEQRGNELTELTTSIKETLSRAPIYFSYENRNDHCTVLMVDYVY